MEEQPKPHFEVGTVLEGWNVYTHCYDFFQVVSHTKSRNPRIVSLNVNRQDVYNTPSQSDCIVAPVIPDRGVATGSPMVARWWTKEGRWGIKIDQTPYLLKKYDPDRTYHNCRYY